MSTNNIYLHEEILLLALKDKEGTISPTTNFSFALGGALLAELLLSKKISLVANKRKQVIQLDNPGLTGNSLIDEGIEKIRTAKKPQKLIYWVSKFSSLKDIKNRTARHLCQRGILKHEEDKVLLIFTRQIYPEINPAPERELIARLRDAIFTETSEIDPRTVVILALAHSSDLLRIVFDKKELKTRKKRIDQIIKGDFIGKELKKVIQEMHAAVIAVTCAASASAAC